MHQKPKGVFLLALLIIFSHSIIAQYTIQSIQDGPWDEVDTWDLDRIPTTSDHVLIQHKVDVTDGSYTVDEIELNNANAGAVWLWLKTSESFNVTKNVKAISYGKGNLDIIVEGSGFFNVGRNLTMDRLAGNSSNARMEFYSDAASETIIAGNFIFNYAGIDSKENSHELELFTRAKILVKGNIIINAESGKEMEWHLSDQSQLTCEGNFILNGTEAKFTEFKIDSGTIFEVQGQAILNNNSIGNYDMTFEIKGVFDLKRGFEVNSIIDNSVINLNVDGAGSELKIGGDFNLDAGTEQDIIIDLNNEAKVTLGGNLNRDGGLGVLNMSNDATWMYKGRGNQIIACTDGTGSDKMNFTNIEFENIGGTMTLEGNLEINQDLYLTEGILLTTTDALLIVHEDTKIFGASTTSHIEGPIKLVTTTDLESFQFPLGEAGVYAPMTISAIDGRAAGGAYTAQYYNCPPPWEVDQSSNISISEDEFWTLSRPSTATQVNVSLHWTDAEAQGIDDPNDLVVAMYNDPLNPNTNFQTGWVSIGNGGVELDGASGSVTNIGTCPPPWEVDNFTFGVPSGGRSLPVNMSSFTAEKKGLQVAIDWSTSEEIDASHFEVQRSRNGEDFFELKRIQAKGDNGIQTYYQFIDVNPVDGFNYYRLRQVDLDGMAVFSDMIAVNFENEIILSAFPNPTPDRFILKGETLNSAKQIKIFNNWGRIIYVKDIAIENNYLNLEFSEFNIQMPGIYYIEIVSGSRSNTLRMIKG